MIIVDKGINIQSEVVPPQQGFYAVYLRAGHLGSDIGKLRKRFFRGPLRGCQEGSCEQSYKGKAFHRSIQETKIRFAELVSKNIFAYVRSNLDF